MKFFDALKMAFHNIWHNKSRTVLTLFIVFIVGTLLMVLNIFAIAFSQNMTNVSRTVFNAKGTTYRFNEYYDYNYSGDYNNRAPGFTEGEMSAFFDKVDEYSHLVDNLSVNSVYLKNGQTSLNIDATLSDLSQTQLEEKLRYAQNNYANIYYTSYIVPVLGEEGFVLEGRTWNKSDRNTNSIWITDSFVEETYKSQNKVLRVGDEMSLVLQSYYNNANGQSVYNYKAQKLVIRGILDASKAELVQEYSSNTLDVAMDLEYYSDFVKVENLNVYSFNLSYSPSSDDYDFNKIYKEIEAFEAAFKGAEFRQPENSGLFGALFPSKRFSAEVINTMGMYQMIGGFVIALIMGISLVIVLLSVGSIANSIIISTDKNKKFIGLMKALGLKNKGVNLIVNLEASIQILIGVFVSFGIMVALKGLMLKILTIAFGSIFKMMAEGIEYTLTLGLPLYVPIAVFGIFLLFALLSARGSLRTLGKMDVIAIMSEAA